ncbi:alpha/beta hydrolase [Methylobacterium sp. A49B]|uniref:Alpha/beta hydrolase n=2 Tax=Methylobacterium mesophilicum TaxID=39956 RepID=A0A6B9FZ38_9HYPH|nr:alpha/beta hydrolase [Methylobacterium mesophilicum SR1.6/6]
MLSYISSKVLGVALMLLNLLAPAEVRVHKDVSYAAGGQQLADVYQPNTAGPHPVVVFLYGGGWRSGSKKAVAFLGAALARQGIVTVIPEYRHFPNGSLSDILTDNAAAVAWTIAHAETFGGDPKRVVVAGHSSGAWAAAMLGLDGTWLEHAGSSPAALAGVIGLSGPYTVSSLTETVDEEVFAGSDPTLQPINHAAGPHPAMLLLTGANDQDVRPSGTIALADRLKAAGNDPEMHIYPGLGHGGTLLSIGLPFARRAPVIADIKHFVEGVHAAL